MATIVCQGLQSCFESHQMHEPRTIRLKLSCFVDEEKRFHNNDDEIKKLSSTAAAADGSHCWSFLQAATSNNNGSKLGTSSKETTAYIHPLDSTRSKSALSEKSLELCTENLGSETGTDIIEDSGGGIFSSSNSPSENGGNVSPRREQQQQQQQKCDVKKVIPQNFPPPLSTITGFASLQVRPRREDGRLIIKATKSVSTHSSVFQAERSHGRLRLRLFEASSDDEQEEREEEEEEEEEEEDVNVIEDDFEEENDGSYMGKEEGEEEEEEEEEEEKEEEEGMIGKNGDVGGEMGIKKFQRPRRRCKEEGELEKKGLLNWEALWVATTS